MPTGIPIPIGTRFARLVVISPGPKTEARQELTSICQCDCGNTVTVRNYRLRIGRSSSCGCFKKHGHCFDGTHSREYGIWKSMIQRCENPKTKKFSDYGGRGITVCERWHDFRNFFEDMGECPPKLTLDRKDNNLGYCKENCRWADWVTQMNNRRSSVRFTVRGITGTQAELCRHFKIEYDTVTSRLGKLDWDLERALTTPVTARHALRGGETFTAFGVTGTFGELCHHFGRSAKQTWQRVNTYGWPLARALSTATFNRGTKANPTSQHIS